MCSSIKNYDFRFIFSMSSLPNDFLFSDEMDDSSISLSSSDSASSASSTSMSDNFLTINEVDA